MNWLQSGEAMGGCTLGIHSNKFVVVNDGGDHGNVAFRQAITILSRDKCTTCTVIITARIVEHENYDLFNSTISKTLCNGISRLQESAFIIMETTDRRKVVPVLYLAALGDIYNFLSISSFYCNESTLL